MLANAVAYVRRSSDSVSQTDSIAQQTKEVEQFAAEKGYKIIRWYTDDAISGDDTEKRQGFKRMIADASEKRDFEFILCWDLARFGRFDSIEAGYYIYPLRKAGVRLVTKADGIIDWNDPMHRMCNSMKQEGKHQQLLDHSANVVRAQRDSAEKGSWLGSPPYGYRIEGKRKNKRLVLDDPSKARAVQRIFQEFVDDGRSMSNIAKRLNEEGFAPPGSRGRPWRFDSVRVILENPAYVGDYASGRYSYGKYNTVLPGKSVKAGKCAKNREEEWVVRRDNHESIIDRETFEKAKAILAKGKTGRSWYAPEENPFVLNGLLRCGKCGGPMWGDKHPRKNGTALSYECGNWLYNGAKACTGTKVYESVVLESLAAHLEDWLGPDAINIAARGVHRKLTTEKELPAAFHDIKRLICPPARPKQDRARLEKQVAKLKTDAAKARGNLVLLDPENIPDAQQRIREMEAERERLEKELEESKPIPEKDVNALATDVFFGLSALAASCRQLTRPESEPASDPAPDEVTAILDSLRQPRKDAVREVKQFLNHMAEIVVHSVAVGTGKGTRHKFQRGEIVLKVGGIRRELNLRFVVVIHAS